MDIELVMSIQLKCHCHSKLKDLCSLSAHFLELFLAESDKCS
jgi:hypothetical protein